MWRTYVSLTLVSASREAEARSLALAPALGEPGASVRRETRSWWLLKKLEGRRGRARARAAAVVQRQRLVLGLAAKLGDGRPAVSLKQTQDRLMQVRSRSRLGNFWLFG